MHNYTTETQGLNTYRTYTIPQDAGFDTVGIGMLQNNTIPGFATMTVAGRDNQCVLKYNVTSRIPLNQYFTGSVNKSRIIGVFENLVNVMMSCEDYMLDPAQVLLNPEDIYVNVGTASTEVIYLPLLDAAQPVNLALFFKNILFSTEYDQNENCNYVSVLINALNKDTGFSLDAFRKILLELKEDTTTKSISKAQEEPKEDVKEAPVQVQVQVQAPVQQQEQQPTVQTEEPVHTGKEVKEKKKLLGFSFGKTKEKKPKQSKSVIPMGMSIPGMEEPDITIPGKEEAVVSQNVPVQTSVARPVVSGGNFGETTVLSSGAGAGETTVLSPTGYNQMDSAIKRATLVRKKNGERITITKDLFHIGKEPAFVDYCIMDNPAVSRSHADIVVQNNEYYIVDNNSKNHTYVDGNQIASQAQIKLKSGCKIVLANEEFEFVR